MNNIFEDTYIGTEAKTRNNQKALQLAVRENTTWRALEDCTLKSNYAPDCRKPIDEEELTKLALETCPFHYNDSLETAYFMGFKAGYKHNWANF